MLSFFSNDVFHCQFSVCVFVLFVLFVFCLFDFLGGGGLKSNSVFAAHYVDACDKNVIFVLSVWSPIFFFHCKLFGRYNDPVSKTVLY